MPEPVVEPSPELLRELEECDRQIEEIRNRPGPDLAYLTVLGTADWEWEKRAIAQGCLDLPASFKDPLSIENKGAA